MPSTCFFSSSLVYSSLLIAVADLSLISIYNLMCKKLIYKTIETITIEIHHRNNRIQFDIFDHRVSEFEFERKKTMQYNKTKHMELIGLKIKLWNHRHRTRVNIPYMLHFFFNHYTLSKSVYAYGYWDFSFSFSSHFELGFYQSNTTVMGSKTNTQ